MKITSSLLLALIIITQISACNTVQGFGKDLQRGGEAIEKTAK
jgi:entericidin B